MTAHHFFVEPADIDDRKLTIAGGEAHHAARVLRVRTGEAITAADDTGRVVDAIVTDVGGVVHAEVVKERFVDAPRPRITLFQALTKGEKVEDVVQKAAEIGVARVVPFVGARSIVRWDDGKRTKAVERWRSVARAAAKQSRSSRLLVVDEVADHVRRATDEPGPVFVLHEGDVAAPLRHVLPDDAPASLVLAVGPEGGFDDDEIEELARAGAEIVRLGPRILRTETAGLVAASIVSFVYGSLG
jgi:16S rRNA (uracil1498-N3)-methyltransferase